MSKGQKFVTLLVLIVLLSLWYMEGPRLRESYAQVMQAKKGKAAPL